MKKKLFFGFALLAIVVGAIFMNVTSTDYSLSDIALANVEALAQSEGGSGCQGCLEWDTRETDYEGVKCKSDGCTEDYQGKCLKWCE